jgi:hypothetical protein
MAKPGTTRRRVLGAAAALPALALPSHVIARSEATRQSSATADWIIWNARLTRYRYIAARAKEAAETGWFRTANDRYYRESAEPDADREAAFTRLDRAESLYWHRYTAPLHEAAVALVLTPAPHVQALRTKIAIMRAHQLDEPGSMERECLEVLEEDVGRLGSPN